MKSSLPHLLCAAFVRKLPDPLFYRYRPTFVMAQSSADTATVRYATEAGTLSPSECGQALSLESKAMPDAVLGVLAGSVCAQVVASPADVYRSDNANIYIYS